MTDSEDPDYLDTKLVKQGFKKLEPIFQELADWIEDKFATPVLNIYYDKIENDTSRLNIIFEYYYQSEKYTDPIGNFDSDKQRVIAEEFIQILSKCTNTSSGFFSRFFQKSKTPKIDKEKLLIIFDAFEPIAIEEINNNIPQIEIDNLKNEFRSKNIWEIYREFGTTTFFFYTTKQIEDYTKDSTTTILKQEYFSLLKKYDEYDYIKADTDFITFDSKENFDKNFQSNWFYYSRR